MLLSSALFALAATATSPCQVKGKIQYVTSSADADLRVRVVTPSTDALPDLRVQVAPWIANCEGCWKIVTHAPDYKIMLVDSGYADFTVQFVSSQPGCRLGC